MHVQLEKAAAKDRKSETGGQENGAAQPQRQQQKGKKGSNMLDEHADEDIIF